MKGWTAARLTGFCLDSGGSIGARADAGQEKSRGLERTARTIHDSP